MRLQNTCLCIQIVYLSCSLRCVYNQQQLEWRCYVSGVVEQDYRSDNCFWTAHTAGVSVLFVWSGWRWEPRWSGEKATVSRISRTKIFWEKDEKDMLSRLIVNVVCKHSTFLQRFQTEIFHRIFSINNHLEIKFRDWNQSQLFYVSLQMTLWKST